MKHMGVIFPIDLSIHLCYQCSVMNAIKAMIQKKVPASIKERGGFLRLVCRDKSPGANLVSIEDGDGGISFQLIPDLSVGRRYLSA